MINGKTYVGQTIQPIRKRFNYHRALLRKNKHHNVHLQRSWNKYSDVNFYFEILETAINCNDVLNYLEIYYIKYFSSFDSKFGYNKTMGGSAYGIITEETRKKLSSIMSGSKNSFYGKKHTPETLYKMHGPNNSSFGKYGKDSRSAKKILATLPNGVQICFSAAVDAARYFKLSKGNISSVCKKRMRHTGGINFNYISKGY